MERAFLDVAVLATPAAPTDADEVRAFVERLTAWHEALLLVSWVVLARSSTGEGVLAGISAYPGWSDIELMLKRFGVREYQARDVHVVVRHMMDRAESVEKLVGVGDWICDGVTVLPADYYALWCNDLRLEHERLLLLAAWPSQACASTVVLSRLPSGVERLAATAEATIELCDPVTACPALPCDVRGGIDIVGEAPAFLLGIDVVQAWVGSDPIHYEPLVRVATYQRLRANGILHEEASDICRSLSFRFHRNFCDGARRSGCLHVDSLARALIGALVSTLTDSERGKVHALRAAEGAGAPQRRRKDDTAWRRDVTYEYHLHYWKTSGGYEFASVGPHGCVDIPG